MNLDQWKELLNDVKPGNGSTEGDLLEQIKKKLEKQDHDTYKKWEHKNFHENHIFTVPLTVGNHQKGTPPVTLLYLAAEAGNIELIGYLIEEKHVDSQSHRFYKLHPIVQHRICQVNRLIEIEKHVDPNLENNSKEQQSFLSKLTDILIHSIESECFEIVEYILGRVSKISCSATREIYTKALIDDKVTKELDSKIGKQKEEHAKYERWTKLKEKLVKNNELLTQDMHSIDRNNTLGKETISLNEKSQELKSTDSRQPQKNVVDDRDASKEQCISNNYKVDEVHNSSQDTNSIEEKLKSNGTEVTATLAGGSVGGINATASNKTTPIDADDKEKQTPNQSVEDQKVAPPDVEQVHKNGEDKFLDAQDSNSKEDTGKSEVFESEAQYVEKIKELSQELNRRATQVDTLTRELENKSKKLHNAKKEVRKFSKAISELREGFTESTEKLVSAKGEEINKLKNQITQLTKELRGKKAQPAEEEKELKDLEKQLYELCFGEEISELALLTKGLEEERDLAVAQKLKQEESFKQAQQEVNNLKAQLAEKEKALINLNQKLEQGTKAQLEQERDKDREIGKLGSQVTKLTEENGQLREELGTTRTQLNGAKAKLKENKRELDSARQNVLKLTNDLEQEKSNQQTTVNNLNSEITQLTDEKSQLLRKLSNMQQNLKGSNLGNENKKLPVANDKSREQSNCASIAFVIAGALAVVASLTIPYLAVCITFAVAASISLIVVGYCFYEANTALSDVKADQITNGANIGANVVA